MSQITDYRAWCDKLNSGEIPPIKRAPDYIAAVNAEALKHYPEMLESGKRLQMKYQFCPEPYLIQAGAYLGLNQQHKARAAIDEAALHGSIRSEYQLTVADFEIKLKNWRRAAKALACYILHDPYSVTAWRTLKSVYPHVPGLSRYFPGIASAMKILAKGVCFWCGCRDRSKTGTACWRMRLLLLGEAPDYNSFFTDLGTSTNTPFTPVWEQKDVQVLGSTVPASSCDVKLKRSLKKHGHLWPFRPGHYWNSNDPLALCFTPGEKENALLSKLIAKAESNIRGPEDRRHVRCLYKRRHKLLKRVRIYQINM